MKQRDKANCIAISSELVTEAEVCLETVKIKLPAIQGQLSISSSCATKIKISEMEEIRIFTPDDKKTIIMGGQTPFLLSGAVGAGCKAFTRSMGDMLKDTHGPSIEETESKAYIEGDQSSGKLKAVPKF